MEWQEVQSQGVTSGESFQAGEDPVESQGGCPGHHMAAQNPEYCVLAVCMDVNQHPTVV